MSVIRPFKAFRPATNELARSIAALPYDVLSSEEAAIKAKDNPYSFLHVDKAEIDLPEGTDLYSPEVYAKAASNLAAMEENGWIKADEKPCLYIYAQTWQGRTQTGIVGCASIDDYLNNVIKKHELTRADKEADRIAHVDACNANTGPIFLTYKGSDIVNKTVRKYTVTEPVYDFTHDGIKQKVWVISEQSDIDQIVTAFQNIDSIYIADGHHRAASAVKVGLKRREENPGYTGEEEFNYFLAVYFKADDLEILDYNRVIVDTNGLSDYEFREKVNEKFWFRYYGRVQFKPKKRHTFGMFLYDSWYSLTPRNKVFDENDPIDSLDVSILQNNIISPILEIDDPRTDKRIDFIGGIRGIDEIEKRCRHSKGVAFAMFPTSIEEVMNVADKGLVMPPKSTWFEPKLLSGLFIHKLS